MDKRKRMERGETVIAMDRLARCVNNENFLDSWLMCGVADGDIDDSTKPEDETLDYYCEDDCFSELLTLFNRIMVRAWKDGGLYSGGIAGMDKREWENYIKE